MSSNHHVPHVSLHLKKTITHDVISVAQSVFNGMSAHTDLFPAPTPALSVLHTQTLALSAAEEAMATRSPTTRAVRDAARSELCVSLDDERSYVQSLVAHAPDNAQTLATSAGMSVTGAPTHTKPVLDVTITPASGTVHLNANSHVLVGKSLKGHLFNWQWSQDSGITWHDGEATATAKAVLTGLPTLTTVHFRVRTVVGGVAGAWSHPVSILVH